MKNTELTEEIRAKFYEEEEDHYDSCSKKNCNRLICRNLKTWIDETSKKTIALEKITEMVEKEATKFAERIRDKSTTIFDKADRL